MKDVYDVLWTKGVLKGYTEARHSELKTRVMEVYCPFFGAFTTGKDDTREKRGYWQAVNAMSIEELQAHL
jgi:hypothetical protein